jgi:hypothetical protein
MGRLEAPFREIQPSINNEAGLKLPRIAASCQTQAGAKANGFIALEIRRKQDHWGETLAPAQTPAQEFEKVVHPAGLEPATF